jgi:hypothetical protein
MSKAISSQGVSIFWPSAHARSAAPRSIGHIAKLQRIKDNDKNYVAAIDMLLELMNDNKAQVHHMRAAHEVADKHEDVATASLLEISLTKPKSAVGSCSRRVARHPGRAKARPATLEGR